MSEDRKPLELDVFNGYRPAKRLADAELAAQYWQALAVLQGVLHGFNEDYDLHDEYAMYATTLHRFATHPHYDEEQA